MSTPKPSVGFTPTTPSPAPLVPSAGAAPQRPTAPAKPKAAPKQSVGVLLATAFDGKLERVRMSVRYQIGILVVAGLMVLLPLVYLAVIAGAGWLTMHWASYGLGIFDYLNHGRAIILAAVIYAGPLVAGGLLVISLVLPMFWRSSKGPRPYWVDRREQPMLYAYVEKLCETMGAPKPARIDVIATSNASAHIDNGVLGLLSRRMVLTIGLPLAASMDLKQFTGVLAHEIGHFSQGLFMRLTYAVQLINGWFGRMGFGRSGIDDFLDNMLSGETHWTISIVAGLSKFVLWIARLVMMLMALISHALCMNLSRQAEFDADRRAARIVGGESMGRALEIVPAVDAAENLALAHAQAGWKSRRLPDDLVQLTAGFQRQLPQELKDKLDAAILSADAGWFDTHPPLFQRVAALKRSKLAGVMKINGPATVVFKDFGELSKLATVDFYGSAIGDSLQPEHLVATVLPKLEKVQPVVP